MLTHFKKGFVGVAAATLLFSAATAQTANPRPEVHRDPFINNHGVTAPVVRPTNGRTTPATITPFAKPESAATTAPNKEEPVVVMVVPAPAVVVSGIVASSGQRQAILSTANGSMIVSVGQKLADYRVKAIDANSVTFDSQGKSFRLALGQES